MKTTISGALLTVALVLGSFAASAKDARQIWVNNLISTADPVLSALSQQQLKMRIPHQQGPFEEGYGDRSKFAPLEAFGRLMAGLAPWLELGPDDSKEGQLRQKYLNLALASVHNAVDPASADYMNFDFFNQPLVDSAYLAQSFLRAPNQLWGNLPEEDKQHVIKAMRKVSQIVDTPYSNWLLFGAMVEAFLLETTGQAQIARIEFGVRKHLEWYAGDGVYSDGPNLHHDYYNSYVIQPMLVDILVVLKKHGHSLGKHYEQVLARSSRYAEVLERQISPEGTYPIIGRSAIYRFGSFQTLGQMALFDSLPSSLQPGQVRAAMQAVMQRFHAKSPVSSFDDQGWLKIGVIGEQIDMAEPYISSGSLYMHALGFLPLGLKAEHPFWTQPARPWTQQQIWQGQPQVVRDTAYKDKP